MLQYEQLADRARSIGISCSPYGCRSLLIAHATNVTRNSSGDEIANVNFLYDDIVHALQNTIDSRINAATGRRGYEHVYSPERLMMMMMMMCNDNDLMCT